MPEMTKDTRSGLVALVQHQPENLAPGEVPTDLLNETRESLSEAFAELGYTGKFFVSRKPGTSGAVHFWEEARWLLNEGKRVGPAQAVRRLEELVTKNEAVLQRVGVIWGLHPNHPIQLSDDPKLTLLSLANLRPSDPRDALLKKDGPNLPHVPQAKPRAAIVHEFIHRPLYFRSGEPRAPFTWDDKHFLSDLSLVLILLGDSPVVRVAEWYQTDDANVPVLGAGLGWARGRADWEISQEIGPRAYDSALAMELVRGFLRFSPEDRRRITVALHRLNLAGLRERRSDVALELGIALEALLTQSDDPHDSIAYRLKTRAAVLLGGTLAEKEAAAQQVSRLYGLRSAAAHGTDLDGHLRGSEFVRVGNKKYAADDLVQTLSGGRQLCGRIARKLLILGSFPNYHRMILGEAPP